ncbi:MAG TPA: hypothetical protein VI749_03705 [Candidatus Omnitrophota bacterium]|nr:hypothetical protein [Candidatus Omnitrophota bacterium]
MTDTQTIKWEPKTRAKYDEMIEKIPLFHREIARQVVEKKAAINAQERGNGQIIEEDIVRAFLTEVPLAFYSLMIRLFDEVGFEYKKYET